MPEVDIILGGHDHIYHREVLEETGVFIVKSGTDFEVFSNVKVEMGVTEEMRNEQEKGIKADDTVYLYSP